MTTFATPPREFVNSSAVLAPNTKLALKELPTDALLSTALQEVPNAMLELVVTPGSASATLAHLALMMALLLIVLSLKLARPTSPVTQSHAHKTVTANLCFAMELLPAPAASPALLMNHALVTATTAEMMVRAPLPNLALLRLRSPIAPRPDIALSLLVKPPELVEPAMLPLLLVHPTVQTLTLAKPITLASLMDAKLTLIASLLPSIAMSTLTSARPSIALKKTRCLSAPRLTIAPLLESADYAIPPVPPKFAPTSTLAML